MFNNLQISDPDGPYILTYIRMFTFASVFIIFGYNEGISPKLSNILTPNTIFKYYLKNYVTIQQGDSLCCNPSVFALAKLWQSYSHTIHKLFTMAYQSIEELAAKKFLNVPIRIMPQHLPPNTQSCSSSYPIHTITSAITQ